MDIPILNNMTIGWRDIVDVVLVTFLFYNAIRVLRETRAVAAVYGILSIIVLYIVSRFLGFNTINWILDNILRSFVLLIAIVFQNDIRNALISLGARKWFTNIFKRKRDNPILDIIAASATYMAERRIGALMVIERDVPLGDTTEGGVKIDALVSKELLINMFWPNSPLHDGAVLLKRNRIVAAGCILPLSTAVAKRDYGTRHRAALGITEETDAVVVVVSEERGVCAVALEGRLTGALDEAKLRRVLQAALEKKT